MINTKKLKLLKTLAFIIFPLAALGCAAALKTENAVRKAPDFSLQDTANKTVTLSSFKGKYVLLDFWASWCKDCRIENKNLVKVYSKFKNEKLVVVSVSLDYDRDNWIKTIETDKLAWSNHLSDLKKWQSPVAKLYDVRSIPQLFIIDPEGNIIAEGLTGQDLENKMGELFPDKK